MLAYSLKLCMSLMQNKQFRNKVLRVLVKIYMNLEKPDFINVCQVLILHDVILLPITLFYAAVLGCDICITLHYVTLCTSNGIMRVSQLIFTTACDN